MLGKIKGLSVQEVERSRKRHGTNALKRQKSKGIVRRFFENLSDPIIKILIAALVLEVVFTLGNCNLVEVFGILAAILIATVVSTASEYGSERAFARIEAESREGVVRVVRDGLPMEIPSDDVVVGDVMLLSAGEKIAADGDIIDGSISVNQSALNGENIEVSKSACPSAGWELDERGRAFRGSIVTAGEAVMRVGRVGGDTFYGMVATDVQDETRVSPLKLRLGKLAGQISRLGYVVALIVGLIYLFNTFVVDNGFVAEAILSSIRDTGFLCRSLIHALTLMITVVVVAVPEGLPMMITVVLSANMKRMVKDNVLVKKLVGIETAGSLNILFTDKTGTLTTGVMAVDSVITADGVYKTLAALRKSGAFTPLILSAVYNTEAKRGDGGIVGGNATERAIAEFFVGEEAPRVAIKEFSPFSSDTKCSSVTLEGGRHLIKGAPESILARTRLAATEDGDVRADSLDGVKKRYYEEMKKGHRVIAVAEERQSGLVFVALIVLKDKLRRGVRAAVKEITDAGIQIVMVTGDNLATASSIAEECGIYRPSAGHIALGGEELRAMSDEELLACLPRLRVVSRALPRDKSRLVRLSQQLELVVGMTGDGVNDAPSLKLADVGFAMGSGTDIAKGAGDIVILDDSIGAIAKTILYGRTIFKSIRKFITFQLIMNFAACGITLIGPFIGVDNPITIIQMLWVNIIMDTLGGLAFAGEAPHAYYMKEKPKRRDEPILSRGAVWHIIPNGLFTLGLLVGFLSLDYFGGFYPDASHHLCAFYALFIFAGLANCFSARAERFFVFSGIGKNRLFILIMMFISAIQLCIIYFGGSLFRSVPLAPRELGLVLLLALSVFAFDLVRRVIRKLSR
ncbi:MAG: calcium-translocating P-type ATPase, PMCA-type [Clostridia bacterium]|nr:calcium-translocating P-type ATPase, PMCA-type [Clostridia bacterium]